MGADIFDWMSIQVKKYFRKGSLLKKPRKKKLMEEAFGFRVYFNV